ncbi:MAG: Gfo/Idh/MocA family oxidoreductase [Gemmataceae bacterium]|nr:Gfo/Idh/MocA family oxidoreductase [Gemmataceae bacterium]
MGLIGGGQGFIGRVHVRAAILDNRAALVAGALSSDPERARALAPDFDLPPERAYASARDLLEMEARLPAGERIDFVTIATPNHTHYEIARVAADAGFNVMCNKPMTLDLGQAENLAQVVERTGVVFAVTHNYTGYPLVRQARDLVRGGELGEINAVRTCYLQGSLRRQRTPEQQRRFAWKTDPATAGPSGCFGDIGIHAYNLARFVTGLRPVKVACTLRIFEPAGRLDDYGIALVRHANGALGTITASRISHGRENGLWIEVDGTRGALEWHQEEPNRLWVRANGRPHRLYTRNPAAPAATARASSRVLGGLPEGFFEAFANVYIAAYDDMAARASGERIGGHDTLYPNVYDGIDGVNFVARCVASSVEGGRWIPFGHPTGRP